MDDRQKIITVSANASFLGVETSFRCFHISLLIPDKISPCSVYIFYKGKYIEVVKRGAVVRIALFGKMYKEENYFFYVLNDEYHLFEYWIKERHSFVALPFFNLNEDKNKIEFRITKYIRYSVESLSFKEDDIVTRKIMKSAETTLRSIVSHPSLYWFFEKDWDKKVIEHTCRVTYLMLLFFVTREKICGDINMLNLISASILHELTGNPEKFNEVLKSKETLDFLKNNHIVLTDDIIRIISNQNEYYDGSGQPNGLLKEDISFANQLLSIFDYFDHSRLIIKNVTRNKALEQVKNNLLAIRSKFEPVIFREFIHFIDLIKF